MYTTFKPDPTWKYRTTGDTKTVPDIGNNQQLQRCMSHKVRNGITTSSPVLVLESPLKALPPAHGDWSSV